MAASIPNEQYDAPFILENMTEEAAIAFGIIIILAFFYAFQIIFLFRIGRAASSKVSELQRRQRLSSLEDNVDMPLISTLNRADAGVFHIPTLLNRAARLLRAKSVIEAIRGDENEEKPMEESQKQHPDLATISAKGEEDVENPMHGREKVGLSDVESADPAEVRDEETETAHKDDRNLLLANDEAESFDEQIQRMRSMTTTSIGSVEHEHEHEHKATGVVGDLSTLVEETDAGAQDELQGGTVAEGTHNPIHLSLEIPTDADMDQVTSATDEKQTARGSEEDRALLRVLEEAARDSEDSGPSTPLVSNRTSENSLSSLVESAAVVALSASAKADELAGSVPVPSSQKRVKVVNKVVRQRSAEAAAAAAAAVAVAETAVVATGSRQVAGQGPPQLGDRKQTRQQSIVGAVQMLRKPSLMLLELNLSGLKISDTILRPIAAALRQNKTLTSLCLANNQIEVEGCTELAWSLGRLSQATLTSNGLLVGGELTPRRSNSSGSLSNVSNFSSPRSRDSSSSSPRPSPALEYNRTLKCLDLSGNAVGARGCKALAEALRFNSSITYLDLSFQTKGKKVGADGATALATLLHLKHKKSNKDMSSLQTLRLARSNIGFEGCRHLASALMSNCTLTELDIGHINYIGISGAMQLGQAIACSPESRLAWLTVGSHRLPISVLLGDRRQYAFVSSVVRAQRTVSALAAAAASIQFSKPRFRGVTHGAIQLTTGKAAGKAAEAKLLKIQLALKKSEQHLRRAEQRLEEIQLADFTGPFPTTLVLEKIKDERYLLHKKFMEKSSHGMDDELAVVVATLLKRNRSLESLKLEQCQLPVQALAGFAAPARRRIDLSDKHIANVDAIIIGSLIADNKVLRLINLKGNSFASTEGENFIAYALDKNPELKLDPAWQPSRIYFDGYLALASAQGMSASGAKIEPQRLEGCFYRSITALAGVQFYFNVGVDIYTIILFASNPLIYRQEYVDLASLLICVPTGLYCYNSLRNVWGIEDLRPALMDSLLAILQLTPGIQAWECVILASETTAYLDYKYVMGMYKQIPWIWLKAYIMLEVACNQGHYDIWVLISLIASLLSIVMVLVMLYDRRDARRLSYLPVSIQPRMARLLADLFTCVGMGRDTKLVRQFVNYDSYYTAHYCLSYVYQIAGLGARVLSISWVCAVADSVYIPMLLTIVLVTRIIVVTLHDRDTFNRTLYNNVVHVLSLCVTDSAWSKDVTKSSDPVSTRACYVGLTLLSTYENGMALLYSAWLHPRGTMLSHMTNEGLFSLGCIFLTVRWFFLYHWALVVQFPELYSASISEKSPKRQARKSGAAGGK